MENRSYALLTGSFLVVMLLALALAVWWLGDHGRDRVPYVVVTDGAVAGVSPYSMVRYRGVEIGQVSYIELGEDGTSDIRIGVELDRDTPVTDKTRATLRSQALTGRAILDLSDSEPGGEPLKTSEADPAVIPMRRTAGENLEEGVGMLIERMGELLDEENQKKFVAILDNLEQTTRHMPTLLSELEQTLVVIRGVGSELETLGRQGTMETLPRINRLLSEWEKLSRELSDEPGGLLFGKAPHKPGPGEPGYEAPQ